MRTYSRVPSSSAVGTSCIQRARNDPGPAIPPTSEANAYWTAYRPGGTDPSRELAAGAGDLGLVKCIRACERHLELQTPARSEGRAVTKDDAGHNVPTTQAQLAL